LADLIHNDAHSRLDYITADERTTDPQELLDSQHMRDVLAKLRSTYDCVVLDAPPVLAVSDAVVLSHLADATVFIVRWEKTPRHVAMSGLKLLHSQGANLAGVVLSCVDTRRHARYDYGDAAYYYGRYRGYYDLGVRPKRLSAPANRSVS
jgi:polysaccharide biosynthesis transport protein